MEVYVHGGVSGVAKDLSTSLHPAVEAGMERGSAVDAVEAAVTWLEDEPSLNAGYGSVLNRAGELELDAGIAWTDASGLLASGAVACVRVKNPIRLARLVAEDTPHALMAGAGAQRLAEANGHEAMLESTPQQHDKWRRARDADRLGDEDFGRPEQVDTVGAVVLDDDGSLAAASSTGGVFGKLPGRVGDAPVFGAGFYASRLVAVVGTGVGELFIESLACRAVAAAVEEGASVDRACRTIAGRLGGNGKAAGLLALDHEGRFGAAFAGGAWRVEGPRGRLEPDRVAGAE